MSIAKVVVEVSVAHLDRTFDYAVPPEMTVEIGSLVRVKWGQRRLNGWVVEVVEAEQSPENSAGEGRALSPILRVLTSRPLFTEKMLETYRYIAKRYASSLSQVLAIAIPQRRARVDKELGSSPVKTQLFPTPTEPHAQTDIRAVYAERASVDLSSAAPGLPRVVCQAVPTLALDHLRELLVEAAAKQIPAIVTAPTVRLARSIHRVLTATGEAELIGFSASEQNPGERYETHLRALRGDYQVVVGTRSAVWTPFQEPAMVIVWEDGSAHYRERRSPQVDVLDVAVARCHIENYGLVSASYSRSLKAQALVESRWAVSLTPGRARLRAAVPKIRHIGVEDFEKYGTNAFASLPDPAVDLIRAGLSRGAVLVQVPGKGRRILANCVECQQPARCAACGAALVIPPTGPLPPTLNCVQCQAVNSGNSCDNCGHQPRGTRLVGAEQVARELGRTVPNTKIVVSASTSRVRTNIAAGPQIVVATPGSEPSVEGGYAAVIVTDAHVSAFADDLNAEESALRNWLNTFALARARSVAMITGEIPESMVRALVMWEPVEFAQKQLEQRVQLGFFPARWIVALDGLSNDVSKVVAQLESPFNELDPAEPPLLIMGTVPLPAKNHTGTKDSTAPEPPEPEGLFELVP